MKFLLILSALCLSAYGSANFDSSGYPVKTDTYEEHADSGKNMVEPDESANVLNFEGYSLLDDFVAIIINKTLAKQAPKLAELHLDNFTINSGQQEFGDFSLGLRNLTLHGLDGLIGETISVHLVANQPLEIRNLTLYVRQFVMTADDYVLGGHITFPIGDKVLPLSGSDGELMIGLNDLRISMYILMGKNETGSYVDQLNMTASASSMMFHADNLMNGAGADVGWAFNTVLNDAAIVAFEYYRDPLIQLYNDKFKLAIGKAICQFLPTC